MSTNNSTEHAVNGTTVNSVSASVANSNGMDMRLHQPEMDEPVAEDVRLVTRNNREYLVFPIIVAREMVLEYPEEDPPTREYLSKERLQESVQLWSGTPLTFIHPNNPQRTAADPFAYTSYSMGEGHDPEIVGDANDKLKVYGWLDVAKAEAIGDLAADVVEKLKAGEELSVSAGYVTLNDRYTEGEFEGEAYDVEQGIVIPDHIAIFPSDEFLARCSPEDGCAAPRVNAVLDQSNIPEDAEMTEQTDGQEDTPDLRICEDIAPALSTRLNAEQADVESALRTLAGESEDRGALARVLVNAYDMRETDIRTVLDRAEAGDITVNASTLSKLIGAGSTATVDPSALRQNAHDGECECGAKVNAEGQVIEPSDDGETPSDAETAPEVGATDSDEETGNESGADPALDDESDTDADTDTDTTADSTETGGEEPTVEDEPDEPTDADADTDEDSSNMPEKLSIEEIAANSAYGLDELQDWDEDELAALEMTILSNNPALADDADGGDEMNENKDEYDDKGNKDEYGDSDDKENTTEAVTKQEFNELKAMVEDAVNSKANSEKQAKARMVANAVEGLDAESAEALDDDALDSLAEAHGVQPQVRTNYGAVAGPVDRQPQGPSEEDVSDMPAGGRAAYEARKNGGD